MTENSSLAATADGTGAVARRTVLAGVGIAGAAVALGACASPSTGTSSTGAAGAGAAPSSAAAAAGGTKLGSTADIPVGGGKVFAAEKVVVTQPTAGTFKAFSAVCTHQQCTVNAVKNGTIDCPCHGSKYRVADGSVAGGPAPKPLPAAHITVEGTDITLA
jgi:Rieske Fe-S protein